MPTADTTAYQTPGYSAQSRQRQMQARSRLKQGSCESQHSSFETEPFSSHSSWRDKYELDVEDALWSIGFGVGDLDPLKRVPIRFLHQTSKVAGNDISNVLGSSSSGSCWCHCHNNNSSASIDLSSTSTTDARNASWPLLNDLNEELDSSQLSSSGATNTNSTILNPVNRQFFEKYFCQRTQNRQLSFATATSPTRPVAPADGFSGIYATGVLSPIITQSSPPSELAKNTSDSPGVVDLSSMAPNNLMRTSTPSSSSMLRAETLPQFSSSEKTTQNNGHVVDHRLRIMQRKLTKLSKIEQHGGDESSAVAKSPPPAPPVLSDCETSAEQQIPPYNLHSRSVSLEEPPQLATNLGVDSSTRLDLMGHSFTSESSGFADAESDSPRIVSPADIQRIDSTGTSNSDTVTIRALSPYDDASFTMLGDCVSHLLEQTGAPSILPEQIIVKQTTDSSCASPKIVVTCGDEETDPKCKSLSELEPKEPSSSPTEGFSLISAKPRWASESCLFVEREFKRRCRATSDPLIGSEIEDYLSSTLVESEMRKLQTILEQCSEQLEQFKLASLSSFRKMESVLAYGTRLNMETVHVTTLDVINEIRNLLRVVKFRTKWTLSQDERRSRIKALSAISGLSFEEPNIYTQAPWLRTNENRLSTSASSSFVAEPSPAQPPSCHCNFVLEEMQNLKTFLIESQRAMHVQLADLALSKESKPGSRCKKLVKKK